MRNIKIEDAPRTRRQSLLSLEKHELVTMVEMSETRIRALEQTEERLRDNIREQRTKAEDTVSFLECELTELQDRIRDTICEMIEGAAKKSKADIVAGMAAVRAIEHVAYSFPDPTRAILRRRMDFQRITALSWYYLCTNIAYIPRPDSPLHELYENAKALEEVHGSATWDMLIDWAGR